MFSIPSIPHVWCVYVCVCLHPSTSIIHSTYIKHRCIFMQMRAANTKRRRTHSTIVRVYYSENVNSSLFQKLANYLNPIQNEHLNPFYFVAMVVCLMAGIVIRVCYSVTIYAQRTYTRYFHALTLHAEDTSIIYFR